MFKKHLKDIEAHFGSLSAYIKFEYFCISLHENLRRAVEFETTDFFV